VKKIILVAIVAILFAGCNITKEVSSKGFPKVFNHIEFIHSGVTIRQYDEVEIKFIKADVSGVLQSENFLLYQIYDLRGNLIETIMDSESMSLVWR